MVAVERGSTVRMTGRADATDPGVPGTAGSLTAAECRAIYRTMCLIRRFEEVAYELALAREVLSIHPCVGQEAVAAGVCAALRPDDYITSTHRGHGHCIAKGGDVRRMMAELMGRVDGMDVLAVYAAASAAVERARTGGGPTLLICSTYRFLGHSTGDPLNYRTEEETKRWREKDPIARLRASLLGNGELTDEQATGLDQEVQALVADAVAFGRTSPKAPAATAYEDVYA